MENYVQHLDKLNQLVETQQPTSIKIMEDNTMTQEAIHALDKEFVKRNYEFLYDYFPTQLEEYQTDPSFYTQHTSLKDVVMNAINDDERFVFYHNVTSLGMHIFDNHFQLRDESVISRGLIEGNLNFTTFGEEFAEGPYVYNFPDCGWVVERIDGEEI